MNDIVKADGELAVSPLVRLREPFPKTEIRHLPRVWCKACRDSRAGCNQHKIIKCGKCDNKISSAHIDLRYVGHAEVTNRLLNVDPEWSWEPVAFDEKGLPQYDANGGLWIRLTVCGVTRLGYGHAEGKRGGDAVKEIIGDAIRNAGMRFGMALDLWTSSDLEIAENGPSDQSDAPVQHLRSVQPGETDQWSTPAPQPQTQARDYLKEAHQAADAEQVRCIYREAVSGGADLRCLNEIADIGRQKAAAEQPPAPTGDEVVEGEVVPEQLAEDANHAAAVAELRAFAKQVGIEDIAADAHAALGAPLDAVSATAIRGLLNQLSGTAA